MSATGPGEAEVVEAVAARLERYRGEGLDRVHGWLHPESAETIAFVLLEQVRRGVAGGVAEIGVHHGKSFLVLANGTRPGERAVALDLFEDQAGNVDGSGRGDREVFETNVAAWAPEAAVSAIGSSSLDITPATARATFGDVRLFSVDGGHTAEITRHDLELAESAVVDGGVVVLDDLLNPHWLGVLTGVVDYLRAEREGTDGTDGPTGLGRLVPFALSENKLYLTTSAEHASTWRGWLATGLPDLLGKPDVELLGHVIDVYGPGSARRRAEAVEARRVEVTARNDLEQARAAERHQRRRARRLRRQRDEARTRLAEVTGSASWRLTGPVRRLRAAAGRRR